MKNYWLKFLFLFLFFFFGLMQAAHALARQPIIIDTDAGRDDLIALMYLAKDPRVAIKAVTIESNGDAHCAPAFRNTAGFLRLLDLAHVPVACGSEAQVTGGHVFPEHIITKEDSLLGAAALLPTVDVPVSHAAVSLLIKTLRAAHEPVNILAIGPLTNIARAYQAAPDIKHKINKIYIMGGAVHVPGNIDNTVINGNVTAEWNIYFDPAAAKIVFANLPVVLVPLDATNQAPFGVEFLARVAGAKHSGAYDFMTSLLKTSEPDLRTGSWYFWDPMAAVVASDEKFCEFKQEKLVVLVRPEIKAGATVVDVKQGAVVKVCERVKVAEFEKRLVEVIRS